MCTGRPAKFRALHRWTTKCRQFCRAEDGSTTIETVIWLPMFMILLGFIINVSMVFFNESQILRVIQDGNRAFSLGRLQDLKEVEDYVLARLAYLDASITIGSEVADGFVTTWLRTPATDLMPVSFMSSVFEGLDVGVSAQHIVEY